MNLVINAQLHRTQQSASLILISRSASAPRGRAVWRGGPRGVRRRGQQPPGAGEGRGRPRVGRRPPGPRGRQRRGAPAGHGAAARRVLLLGRRCLQPSSQRRAAPGAMSTFSRSSRTPLGERGLAHARTRPQPARSLRGKSSGLGAPGAVQAHSPTEARRLGSPREAAAARREGGRRRRRAANSVCQRSPEPAVRAGPTGVPRADPAAWGGRRRRPLLTCRVSRPREPRPLLHERLKARGRRGSEGRATPRTATEGGCPATIPKNSPVSSRLRSGTSACVRAARE